MAAWLQTVFLSKYVCCAPCTAIREKNPQWSDTYYARHTNTGRWNLSITFRLSYRKTEVKRKIFATYTNFPSNEILWSAAWEDTNSNTQIYDRRRITSKWPYVAIETGAPPSSCGRNFLHCAIWSASFGENGLVTAQESRAAASALLLRNVW